MRISTTANPGSCPRTSRINSDPSPAWPTTSYPLRSSRLARPSPINTAPRAPTPRGPSRPTSVTTGVSRSTVRKRARALAGTWARAYDRPGYAASVGGRRSGHRPARARSADSEELGPATRRGRARRRASPGGDDRPAAGDRRVVAPRAWHRPRSDRPAALPPGGPVRDAGALARASARIAEARARRADPRVGPGVQQPGPGDRPVGAHPLPGRAGFAEGAGCRDESRRGRAVQRDGQRHERRRYSAGRGSPGTGIRLRALQPPPPRLGVLRRTDTRPGLWPTRRGRRSFKSLEDRPPAKPGARDQRSQDDGAMSPGGPARPGRPPEPSLWRSHDAGRRSARQPGGLPAHRRRLGGP